MCTLKCTRGFLILLSILFLLIGGALLAGSIYGLIFYGDFLTECFDKAQDPPLEIVLKRHVLWYSLLTCIVGVVMGSLMFLTGMGGLIGTCGEFRSKPTTGGGEVRMKS